MTTIKHGFGYLSNQTNPVWAVIAEVNSATQNFLSIGLLLLAFTVSAYVMINRTQDIAKSLVSSLHITTILAILLYYMGVVGGVSILPPILLLGLLVVESFAIAGLYFSRSDGF